SYINNLQLVVVRYVHRQLLGLDIDDHICALSRCLPGGEAPFEIPLYIIDTYTGESDNAFFFASFFCYQNKRLIEGEQGTCPFSKAAIESDKNGIRNEGCCEFGCRPGVNDPGSGFLSLFELLC